MRPCTQILHLAFLVALCLTLTACPSHSAKGRLAREVEHPAPPADLAFFHSVPVQPMRNANKEAAFITISDQQHLSGLLKARLERVLLQHNFTLTEQPSKAERIISLKILYKGHGNRQDLQTCVRAGYDAALPSLQGKESVLVADLLLVRRTAPGKNAQLRNISSRNKKSSTQVRIGLVTAHEEVLKGHAMDSRHCRLQRGCQVLQAHHRDQKEEIRAQDQEEGQQEKKEQEQGLGKGQAPHKRNLPAVAHRKTKKDPHVQTLVCTLRILFLFGLKSDGRGVPLAPLGNVPRRRP